jgi:uncharacterized protein (DUF2236 family)
VRIVDRFSREGTLLLGAGRAILLQAADPVVAAAIAEHSNFAERPVDRLNNTLTFVYGVMLGTPEQAALVANYTRRAHRGIPTAGDPDRQLWVAATLYQTAVRIYERLHGPLSPTDAQAVLSSYARLGTVLEMPLDRWPATPALFAEYWTDAVADLDVGPPARQVAHDLFHPVTAPLWIRAALPLAALLTADLLDAELRSEFGMPWSRHRARRAAVAWAVIRLATRILPAHLLAAPSRYYLKKLASHAS